MSFADCICTKKNDWQQARSFLPITNNGFEKRILNLILKIQDTLTIFFLTMFCLMFV